MSVRLLELQDGLPLPKDQGSILSLLVQLSKTHEDDFTVLDAETYDVTPKILGNNTPIHEITVFDDGTGLYRIYPRQLGDMGHLAVEVAGESSRASYAETGTQQEINAEWPLHIIGNINVSRQETRMFGIIAYLPTER